jgi:hypothetical protein
VTVLVWSTARAEWTPDGFELAVQLMPPTTERLAAALTEQLQPNLQTLFHDQPFSALAFEDADGEPGQVLITSEALLSIHPRALRACLDGVANTVAGQLAATMTQEQDYLARWLNDLAG